MARLPFWLIVTTFTPIFLACAGDPAGSEGPAATGDDQNVTASTTEVKTDGTINGAPFVAREAAAEGLIRMKATDGSVTLAGVEIHVSASAAICSSFRANERRIVISVQNNGGDLTPGDYPIVTGDPGSIRGKLAQVFFEETNEECLGIPAKQLGAATGTVTITHASQQKVEGTFTVAYEKDGGKSSGSFTAPTCLKSLSAGTVGGGSCKP